MKNSRIVGFGLLLSIVVAFAGCTSHPSADRQIGASANDRNNEPIRRSAPQSPPGTPAFRHVAIGLCEDYPEETRTLAAARRDLEVLRTNHIHVLRIAFGWDSMEPEPGRYDWSFWDDFVRIATDEFGIRLIPYICYTPRWASVSTNEDFWQQPPRDDAAFAEFVSALVSRYKNRIHSWEIWNEPDNHYYWRGPAGQFAELLEAGARAVRRADPSAKVVMGGLAWDLNFLQSILTDPAAIQNVDVINLHNYYETWATEPLERIPEYLGRASDLLHEFHNRQQLWLAEVGYSSFRRGAHVSDQYLAKFREEHTDLSQASALFRALTVACASGQVSLVAWYRINDLPPTQEVIGDANNRHLGILTAQGRTKPALTALRYFNRMLGGRFRCLDDEVRVTKTIGAPVEVHAFQRPDGDVIIVSWLRVYVPGTRGFDLSGNIPDTRTQSITVRFPFPIGRHATVNDELENPLGTISTASRGFSFTVRDETVTVVRVSSGIR